MAKVDIETGYQGLSELAEELMKKYEAESKKSQMLYQMLLQCEWSARKVYRNGELIKYCPICRNGDNKGHKKNCLLGEVLRFSK